MFPRIVPPTASYVLAARVVVASAFALAGDVPAPGYPAFLQWEYVTRQGATDKALWPALHLAARRAARIRSRYKRRHASRINRGYIDEAAYVIAWRHRHLGKRDIP